MFRSCQIGFPDQWLDYASLEVVAGDHLGNVLRARRFEWQRTLAYMDAPTDRAR